MTSDHDWDRLVRYVTGECDPAEARETLHWINADPERVRATDALSSLHRAGGTLPRHWNVDAAWQKVAEPLSRRRALAPRGAPASTRGLASAGAGRFARLAPRLAAGMVIALSGGAFWFFVLNAHHPTSDTRPVAMRETLTQRGQLIQLRLGDGTRVTLDAASRIRYAHDFGVADRARDVHLEGRALFNVAHDPKRPFRIHTSRALVEDIGTRFVVRSYTGDSADRIAVAEGTVALHDARRTVVLNHGDVGIAARGAEPRALRDVDIGADTAWAGGQLVFRDTPLREVVTDLARWYDLEIRLADPALGGRLLTATFGDTPRDAMLADLARALKLRVERVDSVVWLFQR